MIINECKLEEQEIMMVQIFAVFSCSDLETSFQSCLKEPGRSDSFVSSVLFHLIALILCNEYELIRI